MWEYFPISIITLAAAFCTRCNLAIYSLGRPYSTALGLESPQIFISASVAKFHVCQLHCITECLYGGWESLTSSI